MKLISVTREQVKPVIVPVETITITFTREEATVMGHLLGHIGGDPREFPQRLVFDKLYDILFKAGLAGERHIGKSPLRWSRLEYDPGILYLGKQ